jgi:hypothetical protein
MKKPIQILPAVLLSDGAMRQARHLPNAFTLSAPCRYG